jgi:hypothetical protein
VEVNVVDAVLSHKRGEYVGSDVLENVQLVTC